MASLGVMTIRDDVFTARLPQNAMKGVLTQYSPALDIKLL
jgi:hypothetical protein